MRSITARHSKQLGITAGQILLVAGLAVAGGIVLWSVATHTRRNLFNRTCEVNLRELGMALAQYSYDSSGCLPPYTNVESEIATKEHWNRLPTDSSEPEELRLALRLYTDDLTWFCPADPVKAQAKYYLGIRHQFTSYAFPSHHDSSGRDLTLDQIQASAKHGLAYDAAGDRQSCQDGLWFGGSAEYASNHDDGFVNVVLSDLSVRHLPALLEGKVVP